MGRKEMFVQPDGFSHIVYNTHDVRMSVLYLTRASLVLLAAYTY